MPARSVRSAGVTIAATAGVGLVYHVWCAIQGLAAAEWPTAPGRIVESTFEVEVGLRTRTVRTYVDYTYTVGGTSFRGGRLRFGPTVRGVFASADAMRAQAQEERARFAPGREVEVRYNPRRPGLAVLETGSSSQLWLWVGVELIGVAVGALLLWASHLAAV